MLGEDFAVAAEVGGFEGGGGRGLGVELAGEGCEEGCPLRKELVLCFVECLQVVYLF